MIGPVFGRDRRTGVATVVARRYDAESARARYDAFVYVLDITPDDGGTPFRVESEITLKDTPEFTEPGIGDRARVTFNAKGEDVKFDVDALKQATQAAHAERDGRMDAIAAQPAGTGVHSGGGAPLDPELQALMDAEEQERQAGTATPHAAGDDRLDRLAKLGQLHESGVLTDAEFAAEKARILAE